MKKKIIISAIIIAVLMAAAIIPAELFMNGFIRIDPSEKDYPVRGIDVSSYQGEIDWRVLSGQGIDFAFIKATEGSSFVDRNFEYNYSEALKTELRVGAYHFFSYESSGENQAANFIKTVEKTENMLPPVVDLEFYGEYEKNPLSREEVSIELQKCLDRLEENYNVKPIIYATARSYSRYLSGEYEDYDIWIRSMISVPHFQDGRKWTFWQYSDKGKLDGYSGEEKYIDMNVFNGTREDFKKYGKEESK